MRENLKEQLCDKKGYFLNRKIVSLALLAVWMVEFILNFVYMKDFYLEHCMHSDSVGDLLLGKLLAEEGHWFFSNDWHQTTELRVLYDDVIITSLFRFTNNYRLVWLITTTVAFLLVSASIYFLMRSWGASCVGSLLAVTLFENPVNKCFMDYTVWYPAYLFFFCLALLLCGMFGIVWNKEENERVCWLEWVVIVVLSFVSGLCGVRMFMIWFIPAVLVYFFTIWNRAWKELFHKRTLFLAVSLLAAAAGFFVYSHILSPIFGGGSVSVGGTMFRSSSVVSQNFQGIPGLLLSALGLNFDNYRFSWMVIARGMALLFWTVVIGRIVVLMVRKKNDETTSFWIWLLWMTLGITLAFMLLTLEGRSFTDSDRYVVLALWPLIPLFVLTIPEEKKVIRDFVPWMGVLLFLAAALPWGLAIRNQVANSSPNWRNAYVGWLQENGYSFGAATYWNANITTYYSNGEIALKPVMNDEEYSFYAWCTRRSYEEKEPEFILLTREEYQDRQEKYKQEYNIIYEDEWAVILIP